MNNTLQKESDALQLIKNDMDEVIAAARAQGVPTTIVDSLVKQTVKIQTSSDNLEKLAEFTDVHLDQPE